MCNVPVAGFKTAIQGSENKMRDFRQGVGNAPKMEGFAAADGNSNLQSLSSSNLI
jgi:hypothetical protein